MAKRGLQQLRFRDRKAASKNAQAAREQAQRLAREAREQARHASRVGRQDVASRAGAHKPS